MNRPSTVKELLALTGDQLRDALGLVNVYCVDCKHCVECVYCERCDHCAYCVRCKDCVRCLRCAHCEDCMGCWGDVHDKRHMVFNIQLTESQYREVRAKMGEKP